MTDESSPIRTVLSFVDWVFLHLSPWLAAVAWELDWVSFELAAIWILLCIYYLHGEYNE